MSIVYQYLLCGATLTAISVITTKQYRLFPIIIGVVLWPYIVWRVIRGAWI